MEVEVAVGVGAVMVNGAGATGYEARLCILEGEGLLLLDTAAVMVRGELLLTGGGMNVRTPGYKGQAFGGGIDS